MKSQNDVTDIDIQRFDIVVDNISETLFIAIRNGQIIGTINCGHKDKRSAYIRLLYVHDSYRNQGIAARLIGMCCETSKKSGCETLGLQVSDKNIAAISLYKKMGFIVAYEYDDNSTLMIVEL